MKMMNPLRLITVGLALLISGCLLLLVMVIRLVAPSFVLSFLAYVASSIGLLLAIIGLVRRYR